MKIKDMNYKEWREYLNFLVDSKIPKNLYPVWDLENNIQRMIIDGIGINRMIGSKQYNNEEKFIFWTDKNNYIVKEISEFDNDDLIDFLTIYETIYINQLK